MLNGNIREKQVDYRLLVARLTVLIFQNCVLFFAGYATRRVLSGDDRPTGF